ncbi:MAG: tryptophan--tRNA ligase [Byssovorax sp.]
MRQKRVFSGIQPTGTIHLGNYLGAIKQWVASQDQFDNLFCIVDLHAITIPNDPDVLRRKTRELAAILLSAGIDLQKSTLFVQSQVKEHTELAWILTCLATMGQLARMTQFKAKSGAKEEGVGVGLFVYPALMAADILLYQTDCVPVGADQKQHVELTRDLAERFNQTFGETFRIPEPVIPAVGARIMGLDDATKKMSKSDTSPGHALYVLDSPADITKKIKRAVTDSGSEVRFDESRPGLLNLLTIYKAVSGNSNEEIEARFAGKMYGHLKVELAELVVEALRPLREEFARRMKDPGALDAELARGAEKARAIAEVTMTEVKRKVGLG